MAKDPKELEKEMRAHARALMKLAASLGDGKSWPEPVRWVVDELTRAATGRPSCDDGDSPAGLDTRERVVRSLVQALMTTIGDASSSVNAIGWALDQIADDLRKLAPVPPSPRARKAKQYLAVLEAQAAMGAKLEIDRGDAGPWIRADDGEWIYLPPREWEVFDLLTGAGRLGVDGTPRPWTYEELAQAVGLGCRPEDRQNIANRLSELAQRLLDHQVNPFYLERRGGRARFLLRGDPPASGHA
jgi:hypothetical protein